MSKTIVAEFKSRRDAEMAIEHIVQQHDIDRTAVDVTSATSENTSGTEAARADVEDGELKPNNDGEPKLAGKVKVAVQVDEARADEVLSSLTTFHGDVAS